MPESKKSAEARAKKGGFPKSNVVKANSDGYCRCNENDMGYDCKKVLKWKR